MTHRLVLELTKQINVQLGDIEPDMANACIDMIRYVSVGPNHKCHLTFLDLYRTIRAPETIDEDTFYEAVFFLIRKLNVLTQKHEALNPKLGRYQSVPNEQDIIDAISEHDFYNPFTGKKLSLEEFSQQVLTYFSPSECFMRDINVK